MILLIKNAFCFNFEGVCVFWTVLFIEAMSICSLILFYFFSKFITLAPKLHYANCMDSDLHIVLFHIFDVPEATFLFFENFTLPVNHAHFLSSVFQLLVYICILCVCKIALNIYYLVKLHA